MSATATAAPPSVDMPARGWRTRLGPVVGGLALATLILGICLWPLLHTTVFQLNDWLLHEWYIWHQEGSLRAHGLPSLFAHDQAGVFDPHFAFYGGTLYAISGAMALVLGHEAAYLATWVLTFAMAYGGWFWLARQAGLGPWASHAPGILFITSTWALTSTYLLGSWAQTVAFSALVLVLAAGCSILRADRLKPLPALAFAAGVVLYTGSHNLSLVWATTVLLIVGAVAVVAIPPARGLLTRRGLLRLAAIAVPAVLVNAWFLLPAAVYESHTVIGSNPEGAHAMIKSGMWLVTPGHVLTLTRSRADPLVPGYALQLPMLAIGWTAVALVLLRARRSSPWFRATVGLLVVMVVMWVLMTHASLVVALPHPYDMLQAGYRLQAYIMLALGAAVIAVLVLLGRTTSRTRLWTWALVAVLAVTVLQARGQTREPLTGPLKGATWTAAPYLTGVNNPGTMDYVYARVPLYTPDRPLDQVRFSPTEAERTDRAEVTANAAPGDFIWTNLKASPELLHLSGARWVARDPGGNAFLEVAVGATPGAARIVVTTAHPWPVVLGRWLTLAGLLGLGAIAVALGLDAARRRRRTVAEGRPLSAGSGRSRRAR
jgi:hypothetical protein